MATMRLVPSAYSVSNSTVTVQNAVNMYTDTDSTTYATITHTTSGTTSYYLYLKGFDFSDVPDNAVVTGFTVMVRGYESGLSTSTSYAPRLYNNTSTISGASAASTTFGTTARTITVPYTGEFEALAGYGSNLGIRLTIRRSSRNTQGYLYIYGAEIEVEYYIPVYHDVTLTNTTSATVAVSDAHPLEGSDVTVTASTLNGIAVTDNGTDVTNSFVQGGTGTATSYPTTYDASGSISGTHYQQCIGQGLDNTVSGNDYASSSGSTAHIDYSFDFSEIPAGAAIQSVSVKVKGHCESTSSSSEVATLRLYSGSTAKGSESEFTSTSDQTVTMTAGTWTQAELQSAILRFTIGYYGGAVSGAEWTVAYELDGWVYTISNVVADHAIVVSAASSTALYVKQSSAWVQVIRAYRKANGSWQEVALDAAFSAGTRYRRSS